MTVSATPRRTWTGLIAGGFLCLACASASAGYTVIEDDLYPTAVVEARNTPSRRTEADHYAIPFAKSQSALGIQARAILDTLLPHMDNAVIRIVGRADVATNTPQLRALPGSRAFAIREYLVRQGVPGGNITVGTDESPNPQANNSYPSDIYITRSEGRMAAAASIYTPQEAIVQPSRAAPTPSYTPTRQAPATMAVSPRSTTNDPLIQYINQAVQAGQMSPSTALKLLRTLMESEPSPQLAQGQQPTPQPLAIASPAMVAPTRNDNWVLDKKLTLRGNVDAWSKRAGWNPAVWEASNAYEVTTTSNLDGNFPDVLRQIADSTGLNICAKNRERYVRITDANVSCK